MNHFLQNLCDHIGIGFVQYFCAKLGREEGRMRPKKYVSCRVEPPLREICPHRHPSEGKSFQNSSNPRKSITKRRMKCACMRYLSRDVRRQLCQVRRE